MGWLRSGGDARLVGRESWCKRHRSHQRCSVCDLREAVTETRLGLAGSLEERSAGSRTDGLPK